MGVMLDVSNSGGLDRIKSREWLRAMGFCISDEELNAMLDVHGPSRGTSHGGKPKDRTYWSLSMLSSVCKENNERENSSVKELVAALQKLAGGKTKISKDKLTEFTVQEL